MTRCTTGAGRPVFRGRFLRNSLFLSLIALAPTACTTAPTVGPPVFIHDKTYLPIPATLTAPIAVDLGDGVTWGQAVGDLKAGLGVCNARLGAIESLKSPDPRTDGGSPKPPINPLR